MTRRSTRLLAAIAIALVLGVFLLNRAGHDYDMVTEVKLLPGFREHINDVDKIVVKQNDTTTSIAKHDGNWVVDEKGGYSADTGKLREVLLALADAEKLEKKTANADMHDKLGLVAPPDGKGVAITIDGANSLHDAIIVGKAAQRSNRYVRLADDDQAWLIDKNPGLPEAASGWLDTTIVDLPGARMQSVTITHSDGERIHLEKSSNADTEFAVSDIPEGRALTYPGVVNGIAGVLANLKLSDVRRQPDALPDSATTVSYTTFDRLIITVRKLRIDDADWLAFEASVLPTANATADDAATTDLAGSPTDATTTDVDAATNADTAADEDSKPATDDAAATTDQPPAPNPVDEAATINARVGGWLYQLPSYKGDQLDKHWSDLLQALDSDDDSG